MADHQPDLNHKGHHKGPAGKKIIFSAFLAAGLFVLVLLFFVFAPDRDSLSQAEQAMAGQVNSFTVYESSKYEPPKKAPALDVFDLQDQAHALVDGKGRYLIVNFWATWCPPCIKEIPTLRSLEKSLDPERFEILFISMDFPENGAQLGEMINKKKGFGPDFTSYYVKDQAVWNRYGLKGMPTSFVIGPQGHILYEMRGDMDWDSAVVRTFLKEIQK